MISTKLGLGLCVCAPHSLWDFHSRDQPGTEPGPSTVRVQRPNCWITRDSWGWSFERKKDFLQPLFYDFFAYIEGFPDSSVGKESVCNTGDPGSIPGSGRSAVEGIGHPLQYSWASLVAQLVKNLPAMLLLNIKLFWCWPCFLKSFPLLPAIKFSAWDSNSIPFLFSCIELVKSTTG